MSDRINHQDKRERANDTMANIDSWQKKYKATYHKKWQRKSVDTQKTLWGQIKLWGIDKIKLPIATIIDKFKNNKDK